MEAKVTDTYKLADLVVTGDVVKLVGAIDEFKGAWKAIGRIAPERLLSNLNIKAFASRDEQDERHRGEYKSLRNDVAAFAAGGKNPGVVFETTTPFDTPRLMAEFGTVNQALKDNEAHPLIVIAVSIVSFLVIRPFQDGNGRLSRVLTTLLRLRSGYTYVPYSSLESVIEQTKERY